MTASSWRDARANLRRSYLDGIGWAWMVGLGEWLLPPFVLAVGLGQAFSGWVMTLSMLAGALLQAATPELVRRLGSQRRWVATFAALQGSVFFPLAWLAWRGEATASVVFALAIAYWAFGLATGPVWITWITSLVPTSVRHRYFALRNRGLHAAQLLALLFGGFLLHQAKKDSWVMGAYALLFFLAGVARLWSAWWLALHSEPRRMPQGFVVVKRRVVLRHLLFEQRGRVVRFMLSAQFATQMAQPFFTAFMLSHLQLDYATFTVLLAAPFAARTLSAPLLGHFARTHGAHATVWLGGWALVPVALPWAFSDSVPILFVAQVATGFAWAAYELGTFLCFFETMPERERMSAYTLFNVLHSAAWALGAGLGGWLITLGSTSSDAYRWVFLGSTAARLVSVVWLRGLEPRAAHPRDV